MEGGPAQTLGDLMGVLEATDAAVSARIAEAVRRGLFKAGVIVTSHRIIPHSWTRQSGPRRILAILVNWCDEEIIYVYTVCGCLCGFEALRKDFAGTTDVDPTDPLIPLTRHHMGVNTLRVVRTALDALGYPPLAGLQIPYESAAVPK